MTKDNLNHQLLYSWEPESNPNDGAYHIYDRPLSNLKVRVILDDKYLYGLKVSNKLTDFTNIEMQTGTDSSLHNALSPTFQELMDKKFPFLN